ncbi:MAG: DinB family protein [Chitinophagales bacterium]
MQQEFDWLKTTRQNVLNILKDFSLAQLNEIPAGYNNNLAWHLGHLVVTQQLLCYKLSGNSSTIQDVIIDKYRKGTTPKENVSQEEIDWIKEKLLTTVDEMQVDYDNNIFDKFKEYPTSYNITLRSIEDSIRFNTLHEALHFGNIISMRKLV